MNCSRSLLEAYMDQELDPGLAASVEEHLQGCADCSQAYTHLRAQQAAIRQGPYYNAPAHLERSIRDALRHSAGSSHHAAWRWLAIAAMALLAVSLAWNFRPRPAERDLVAQAIVSGHIRSLIGTHLLDVPSTDQHTVKPWFNGKLDFSPEVKDFAAQGFPLVGGRLDYLMDRPVAALVYARRQHLINVFTWPSAEPAAASQYSRNGYTAIHWSRGPMTFWAVSDLAPAELAQFKSLYEQ